MMRSERQELVIAELKRQLWLAVPLSSVGILQYILQTISIMFVGHLGTLPLSGASMATSFASVTGFTLLMGITSALDTFCGQSNGAEQYHMLGIHMQRAMIVVSIVSVFLAIIWANTKQILVVMHQDKAISKEAGSYALFLIPSLFAYGPLQCILKFLQTQNIVLPMVITSGIAALLHTLLCWLLVFEFKLGSKGAAISNSICYWVNVLLISLYVKFSSTCKQTWTGFSKRALQDLFVFLRLAIPSALMVCLKVWTFELMVLMSGLLPNPVIETSVLSICLNTFGLAWMIPFGCSCAVSIRVSNELGGGNPNGASLAVRVALSISFIAALFMVLSMILARKVWGHLYSDDKQVIRYVSAMMPILAISSFLDAIQSTLSGVLAGCGWQKIGAYVNLGSFYVVGVPCAVVLAFFVHMHAMGLWLGIISAFIVQTSLYIIFTIRSNWEEEAKKAQSRVERSTTTPNTTTLRDSISPSQKLEQIP
ncbi:putative multi antimicrobial extrusion protein [Medicago truncatula]|uniref:Protein DETOXIFICATION n=1 Tax=Medicago truncatula TaxID=3880 RepID=G7LCG8_MEDTR|nr:protein DETOXIFICATION 16 [Medicago truncatula]AET05535.1 MATE efflux family protein [Medicago truncatula]RHN43876.1 putative multi antimicrobial extrusion protein [Medicago truncatula]